MGRINRAHARSCEEAVLASLTWICDAEQLYTDVALVLDAFTRVAAAAGSSLIDLQLHCVVDHADGSQAASTCSREEAVLASLGWICDAEKRCTDEALVLDAFTRVAAAAGSSLIDLHLQCVVDHADGSHEPCSYARCCEEADLASLGWILYAEQQCIDAAFVLDASTGVAAAARSGVIDLRFAPRCSMTMCRISMFGFFVGPIP